MTSRVEPRPEGKNPAMHARSGRLASLAPVALLLLAACGGEERFPMTSLAPKSDFAREIDGLFRLTLYMGVGVGILVFIAMGYILYRFRHRPGAPEPEHVHGNTTLEFTWTLIPAILIAIIAVPTVRVTFSTQPEPPADALVIDVIGWQWWWEFRYPLENGDTVVTANEVHVPTGRTVHFRMTGGDIIHSFWVPQMGGKRDLIPNRINSIVMTPEVPGVYMGACAEFCGESHALMQMRLIAHPPGGFEQWLRDEARPAVEPVDSAIMIGKQLATQGSCAGCHAIRGTGAEFGRAGPDLTHFARRRTLAAGIMENNAENLATWLRNSPAVKPGSLMPNLDLSEEEIGYLVAYLQSLY
jgi:cytochrome c oxidase subunit II